MEPPQVSYRPLAPGDLAAIKVQLLPFRYLICVYIHTLVTNACQYLAH